MNKKTYIFDFKLPQLAAAHYWQSVTVEANNLEQGLKFAYRELRKRPLVKGKSLKSGEIKFEEVG